MSARKRTKPQRERDLVTIGALILQGKTLREIAESLARECGYSLSVQAVHRDVQTLYARWREAAGEAIETFKARELARLDLVEREAWAEWHKSKQPSMKLVTVESEKDARKQTTVEQKTGDPRYLSAVQSAIEQRCRIVGLEDGFAERLDHLERLLRN